MKRLGVTTLAVASLGLFGAAPAHAVNHPFFVPADDCAASLNAGGGMGFDNVSTAPGQPIPQRIEHTKGPQAQNNSQAPANCN